MRALPFERLTSALTPSIRFRIFVTSITQWAQFIPDIFIVLRLTTRPASFFFGIFPLPGQLPPAGHPMHFTPFFFALIMYADALPIRSARIMITIISAITNDILSSQRQAADKILPFVRRRLFMISSYAVCRLCSAYAVCRLYSAANSLSDLRILHTMTAANARTAISPGTNAVPRAPVVIRVPI